MYFAVPDPGPSVRLTRGQASACTVLVWVLAIIVYAVPYVAAGLLTPMQAVFESTSGLTTTGLSVVDVDTCPAIFLFYRSLTCYLGGVGLVLILTCVVSQTGGLGVYNAEGHTDHLLPSAAKTARLILLIYTGLILGGALAYGLAGMTPFDALNISMCAVPTGGFATHSESIAYWHSPLIDGITIVLMIAGGTNFLLLFLLLRGKLKALLTHIETPLYFGAVAIATPVVAGFFLAQGTAADVPDALRHSLFQVVSVLTSTGFQTIPSFGDLSPALLFLFGLLMLAGAEARSTSGGIKLYRVAVAARGLAHDLHGRYGNKRTLQAARDQHQNQSLRETLGAHRRGRVRGPDLRGPVPAGGGRGHLPAHPVRGHPAGGAVRLHLLPGQHRCGHGVPRRRKRASAPVHRVCGYAARPPRDHPAVSGREGPRLDGVERSSS